MNFVSRKAYKNLPSFRPERQGGGKKGGSQLGRRNNVKVVEKTEENQREGRSGESCEKDRRLTKELKA